MYMYFLANINQPLYPSESKFNIHCLFIVVTSSTMGPRLVMIPLDTVSGLVVLVESRDDCLLTSGDAISTSREATSLSV